MMPPGDAALPDLPSIVDKLARELHPERIGTGTLARLRRMDPTGSLSEPGLHRLVARHVPDEVARGARLREWALLIHAMALAAPDYHRGRDGLGRPLHAAGFSEMRLTSLLAARTPDLPAVVPRVARFLVARNQALDPVALAWLLRGIATGGDSAEAQRTRLARDYYRAERDAA